MSRLQLTSLGFRGYRQGEAAKKKVGEPEERELIQGQVENDFKIVEVRPDFSRDKKGLNCHDKL
jgi:hypothetical protein